MDILAELPLCDLIVVHYRVATRPNQEVILTRSNDMVDLKMVESLRSDSSNRIH